MIIGICGLIGAGKDTVADCLVNMHEFRRESFASTLKDAVAAVFGWDRTLLEGRTSEARAWREQVDPWWAERLNMPDLTPRWVLQYWGTEVCRRAFHDDIWIASLENKLRNSRDNIVISDCRFPNEINSIRRAGGKIIRVVRGSEPDWYNFALDLNLNNSEQAKWELIERKIHVSESSWIGTDFDMILDNNGLISHLYSNINDLVRDLRLSTATLP
jgi:hypothetical protein